MRHVSTVIDGRGNTIERYEPEPDSSEAATVLKIKRSERGTAAGDTPASIEAWYWAHVGARGA